MGLFFDVSPEWQDRIGLLGAAIQDYGSRYAGQSANAVDNFQRKLEQREEPSTDALVNSVRLARILNETKARQRLHPFPAYEPVRVPTQQLWTGITPAPLDRVF